MKKLVLLLFLISGVSYSQEILYETVNRSCPRYLTTEKIDLSHSNYLKVIVGNEGEIQLFKLRECYSGNDQMLCHFFDEEKDHLITIFDDYYDGNLILYRNCYYAKPNG